VGVRRLQALLFVPTLGVGTHFLDALRPVLKRRKLLHGAGRGAAQMHSHAERGNEEKSTRAQRELAQNSHHCPHGRHTSLRFSRSDLERWGAETGGKGPRRKSPPRPWALPSVSGPSFFLVPQFLRLIFSPTIK
jgi:hypothetical protein